MSSPGEIIYKAFMPTLKMMIGIGVGFAITKTGIFPPQCAKGVSILTLNISLPALIFASMVPSFNDTNISAFGGLVLAASMYMSIGAAFGWIIREVFYVPIDFRYGIIVCGALSNWVNVPVAVVMTVGNQAPFRQGDVEAGIAYIGVFSFVFLVILFPGGLHKLCALDFKEESLARRPPLPFRARWKARFDSVKRLFGRNSQAPSAGQLELPGVPHNKAPSARGSHEGSENREVLGDLRPVKSPYAGGGAPTRQTSRTPSFTSMLESTRSIPPTAPLEAVDIGHGQYSGPSNTEKEISTDANGDQLLPTVSHHGKAYSYHQPPSPVASVKRPSPWKRLTAILSGLLMPVSISVIISIPCALIPPIRALFTNTPGWTGSRMPNGLDGKPPLSFFLESAAFIGGICIPAGLILLGASFARLKGAWSLKGQPVGAIFAMAICKMVIMPIIGTFFIKNQTGIYPPEDRIRTFVCILLSGTPAAVNQLVVTQLYNPEGSAHTLARFLLIQYILMPILSTVLAGVALYVCQR